MQKSKMNKKNLWCVLAVALLAGCATTNSSVSDAELAKEAKQGNGKAQYELAKRLAAQPDYPQAMHWMQQAAGQSGPLAADNKVRGAAALQVGHWYQLGLGEPKSPQLAEQWWQRASRLGNREASYQLGLACRSEHQGKLATDCLDWFERAARQDHAGAQLILGEWYASQPGADQDAIEWLEKSAEQGNRDAQYQLALRYQQGKGVVKRPDIAMRWFEKAAAQQHPDALYVLATEASPRTVFEAYQRAANAGSAPAQLWLGMAYLAGEQVAADPALGRYWLELAAGNGAHEAEYQLSLQQSDASSREHWLSLAAQGGISKAQVELATLQQERGELELAREGFALASKQGELDAQYAYGEMLRLGQGGKEDYGLALKQYRLAANAGHREAQYRMGMMRDQGLGAPRNRLHAYAWYLLAATDGNKEATQARNELEKEMTEKEKSAGQKLAQHWFDRLAKGKQLDS